VDIIKTVNPVGYPGTVTLLDHIFNNQEIITISGNINAVPAGFDSISLYHNVFAAQANIPVINANVP